MSSENNHIGEPGSRPGQVRSSTQPNALGSPQNAALVARAPAPAAQQPKGGQQQFSQADLNRIVLEYLNKKGYHKTESMLRLESSNTPTAAIPGVSPANTAFTGPGEGRQKELESAGSQEKEVRDLRDRQLRVERELRETKDRELRLAKEKELRELKDEEEKRKRDNDPDIYSRAYGILRSWVETSLDLYKPELTRLLYPMFIHCFLELIAKGYPAHAKTFLDKFKEDHAVLHGLEISQLAGISLPEHLRENSLAQAYRTSKYRIIVSKTTVNLLLYFLHENEAVGGAILIRIINQYLNPVIATTKPDKIDQAGEANPEEGLPNYITRTNEIDAFNDQPVQLGKLPLEPEVEKEIEAELKVKDEIGSTVNGKTLVDEFKELTAAEEDSPARELLPLPLKDYLDIKRYIMGVEDLRSKIRLGAIQASAPSVCMYTFHNTNNDMTCLSFNDDATVAAGGFQDSFIKLWSVDGKPLKSVFKRDAANSDNSRKLVGHGGPVYGLSFSPDNKFLLLGLEDKTVRLWSLDSYTALVLYKGHNQPVWDVKFLPLGHYFASVSQDQTARLWATDHIYPLRIFAGHINDVDCVEFHPNLAYVFTGLSDKTCRMWDVQTGSCVRIFMGHTGPVNCMAVSPDGRWLASAGEDSVVNVWDAGLGRRLKTMKGHGRSSIYSLAFSRDGDVLVSGAADNTVRVWDVKKGTADAGPEPEAFSAETLAAQADGKAEKARKEIVASSDHMTAYFTKKTPVFKVQFTRRNLCLAGGAFAG